MVLRRMENRIRVVVDIVVGMFNISKVWEGKIVG